VHRPAHDAGQRIGWVLRDRPAKTSGRDGAGATRPGGHGAGHVRPGSKARLMRSSVYVVLAVSTGLMLQEWTGAPLAGQASGAGGVTRAGE